MYNGVLNNVEYDITEKYHIQYHWYIIQIFTMNVAKIFLNNSIDKSQFLWYNERIRIIIA
jgi:hypothetical protein